MLFTKLTMNACISSVVDESISLYGTDCLMLVLASISIFIELILDFTKISSEFYNVLKKKNSNSSPIRINAIMQQ